MPTPIQQRSAAITPLPSYSSILLAVDASDHSDRAALDTLALAAKLGSEVTATHVYAAKLHDLRFRQMEAGLPEQFREEQELERQRDVHDDLITRGLSIITDSYLDQVDRLAREPAIQVARRALEGKNYRELINEANSDKYDLLVMGSQGVGAVQSGRLGSVCFRVARRSNPDILVIKEPNRSIAEGPIVVTVDGSAKSYGGLLTALTLAGIWNVKVQVLSAFDPHYHYVAFNRIAGVLSDEAGQLFKFKEQEKLHEKIIDSGLAKIYQSHLSVAASIAQDYGIEVDTQLLDGKPHDAIARKLQALNPSLLILGKTGIHADPGLDIGSNAEQLLSDAPCAVLLSQREHQPQIDRLAGLTTSWTREAEERLQRAPSFVRPMARMAILRYAQERGHTLITESIVAEATAQLMPNHAEQAMEEIVAAKEQGDRRRSLVSDTRIIWSEEAKRLLLGIEDLSVRGNLSMRAEKRARIAGSSKVEAEHLSQEPGSGDEVPGRASGEAKPLTSNLEPSTWNLHWHVAALARLMRVPEGFMRDSSRRRIESYAKARGQSEVTIAIAEAGLAEARGIMQQEPGAERQEPGTRDEEPGRGNEPATVRTCPLNPEPQTSNLNWSPEAVSLLRNVPAGFCRDMTHKAAETIAAKNGLEHIDATFVQQVMETFKAGSDAHAAESMPWMESARDRITRAPEMVRGMLIREIEGWSRRNGLERVSGEAVDSVKEIWAKRGVFHTDPNDERSR